MMKIKGYILLAGAFLLGMLLMAAIISKTFSSAMMLAGGILFIGFIVFVMLRSEYKQSIRQINAKKQTRQ